jgi:hypothetical protein
MLAGSAEAASSKGVRRSSSSKRHSPRSLVVSLAPKYGTPRDIGYWMKA